MVGTHNSMTYLRAVSPLWEAISCWWRCQDKTLDEQIAAGVRWFDIRIAYNNKPGGPLWKFAHGGADLEYADGPGLRDVLERVEECGGLVRVMLEKGDEEAEQLFAEYFNEASTTKRWPCITGAVIKKGWRVLWSKGEPQLVDRSYVPYKRDTAWWKQLKGIVGFPWKSLKRRAKGGKRPAEWQWGKKGKVWIYDFV